MYALKQNKGNADGLRNAFTATVPHMYGDHASCNELWCFYKKDSAVYKHKGLPFGRDLSCAKTREELQTFFNVYKENASKLASIGSSQVNEGFNNIVASKQPKARSYGSSPSFNFRVGAAVCQKNIGYSYVNEVLEKAALSPSRGSEHHGRINGSKGKGRRKQKAVSRIQTTAPDSEGKQTHETGSIRVTRE